MYLKKIHGPVVTGCGFIEDIRKLDEPLKKIPVIVISGSSKLSDAKKPGEKGFSGFIKKPFTEAELVKQIANALK